MDVDNPFLRAGMAGTRPRTATVTARRAMPRNPPTAQVTADGRLRCGHCQAHLKGIWDLREFFRRWDQPGQPPPPLMSELWRADRDTWEETVWCVRHSAKKRARHTGKLCWRREVGLERRIIEAFYGCRVWTWPGQFPAWVQCWRCDAVNLVVTAPLVP